MNTASPRKPEDEIQKNNHWYTDDQFKLQMDNPAVRHVIEGRWDIFSSVINGYIAEANVQGPLQFLDAGCGDGINLIGVKSILDKTGRAYAMHACDYNDLRLERARRFDFVSSFKQVDLLHSPYDNDSFDIVLCNHVLEHIPEIKSAIKEIHRMLKPGGRAILNIPNEGCLMAQLRNNVFQREILKTTDHVHFLTKRSFGKILYDLNMPVERWERRGFFLPYLPLTAFTRRYRWGRKFEQLCGRVFPSQGTDLLVVIGKS